jgi:Raf kinase inhibitor-like YbhB/YbcL family protein
MRGRVFLAVAVIAAALAIPAAALAGARASAAGTGMRLSSPAFRNGGTIPSHYTCKGADVSPPLRFSGVPGSARSLAVEVIDLTAHGFTHWTIWNLSPHLRGLATKQVPAGARQGVNDFGTTGYGGPCPPAGKAHHYQFTLFALRRPLPLSNGSSPAAFRAEVRRLAFAHATLLGLFGVGGRHPRSGHHHHHHRRRQPAFTG